MEIAQLQQIGIEALINSKKRHDELGDDGLRKDRRNQFGDVALRGDLECEEVMLDTLRKYRVPIRVISEEYGVVDITENPIYLGIADGIDGSSVYLKERGKGRYGTMLGIFANLDPVYADYLFSGIMEHPTNTLHYALPGKGSLRLNLSTNQSKVLRTSGRRGVEEVAFLYHTLAYNDVSRETFKGVPDWFESGAVTSSAMSFADIASGEADVMVEVTRKMNLEQMIAFGLINEAGGAMITLDGDSIGKRHYHEFGQEQSIPLITAASLELALGIRSRILTNQNT